MEKERSMKGIAGFLAVMMTFAALPARAQSTTHLVAPAAVDGALRDAADARARDVARVEALLASGEAQQAAARLGVSIDGVRVAASRLSDAERSDLLQRADALAADPAAGLDSDIHELLVILLIVVIVVVVLDAVK
jgi:hypothetical protein